MRLMPSGVGSKGMETLRALLLLFYAPARGLSIAREEASLALAALCALVAQTLYSLYTEAGQMHLVEGGRGAEQLAGAAFYIGVFFGSTLVLMLLAAAFVPLVIFIANLFERRASFRVVLNQEYASTAACLFLAWAAANLAALPLAIAARVSGFERIVFESVSRAQELQRLLAAGGETAASVEPGLLFGLLGNMLGMLLISPVTFFVLWAVAAVREVFRLAWWRAVAVVVLSGILMIPAGAVLLPLFSFLSGSILLLLFAAIILRGYFGELARAQRARASFRQNLEAATLNPADASAHYQLGLIHLDRKELTEARSRFARAAEIDPEEIDAQYQLGRISRREGKYAEAIEHFGKVVTHDQTHAQHEVWREIGATYLAAGQAEDARDALDRFLDHRQSDPEALYLMGRSLAALDRPREARELMQRCIEAVRSAPAYKYRMEKQWMSEAQTFLRSQA